MVWSIYFENQYIYIIKRYKFYRRYSINSFIVLMMAVLGYSYGKVEIGPFSWQSNGTLTEELADLGRVVKWGEK